MPIEIKVIRNGDGERAVGAQKIKEPIAPAQIQNLLLQDDDQEVKQPAFEVVIPAIVMLAGAIAVEDPETKKMLEIYGVDLKLRLQSETVAEMFKLVHGHKVGIKFVALEEDGT